MDTPETISAYLQRELKHSCPYVRHAPPGADGFLSRAKRALLEGLLRLDALPRDDPFWRNTNHRATLFKLWGFTEYLLQKDPCDEQALWCRIALDQRGGSGYLSTAEWRQLHRCGKLDVRWPIHSAYYIAASLSEYASSRACLSRDLALFLRDEDLCAGAEPVLLALPSEVQPPLPELIYPISRTDWAARVLHGMQEPGLWDGISRIDALNDRFLGFGADLLQRADVRADEQVREAARMGWESAHPSSPWSGQQQVAFEEYLERRIRPDAEFAFEPTEQRLIFLFGSAAYGMLLGLWSCGALDEDGFHIGEEYLSSLLITVHWDLGAPARS